MTALAIVGLGLLALVSGPGDVDAIQLKARKAARASLERQRQYRFTFRMRVSIAAEGGWQKDLEGIEFSWEHRNRNGCVFGVVFEDIQDAAPAEDDCVPADAPFDPFAYLFARVAAVNGPVESRDGRREYVLSFAARPQARTKRLEDRCRNHTSVELRVDAETFRLASADFEIAGKGCLAKRAGLVSLLAPGSHIHQDYDVSHEANPLIQSREILLSFKKTLGRQVWLGREWEFEPAAKPVTTVMLERARLERRRKLAINPVDVR